MKCQLEIWLAAPEITRLLPNRALALLFPVLYYVFESEYQHLDLKLLSFRVKLCCSACADGQQTLYSC